MKKRTNFEEKVNICFHSNDIRCIYGKELDEIMYRTGRAAVEVLKIKEIMIGRDMRKSSAALVKSFIRGVRDQGCNVIYIGLIDTPGVYFASGFYEKAAAMITASHNPLDYNGTKLVRSGAIPINFGSGLKQIRNLILKNKFKKIKKRGKLIQKNIFLDYKKHVLSFINLKNLRKMKIVVDAGNGMAGKVVPRIYKNLPIKIIPLDFNIKEISPRHVANPAVFKNLRHLQKSVKKHKADFGMSFDSDMDRIFFVDERGSIVRSSETASLIIKEYIKQNKACTNVIYSLICSDIIKETINQYCGKSIRAKVGHAYIKNRMKETNSIFAIERSGHYYYGSNFFADSAIITSLIVAEIYSNNNKKLSELIKEFRKYSKIEERSFKVKDNKKVIKKIEQIYKKQKPKIDHFDGLTMRFKDFWFNIRSSHTEPLLRVNLEAYNTREKMNKEKKKIIGLIKKYKNL